MLCMVSIIPLLLAGMVFEYTPSEDAMVKYTTSISNIYLSEGEVLSLPLRSIRSSLDYVDHFFIKARLVILTKTEDLKDLKILCSLSIREIKVFSRTFRESELDMFSWEGGKFVLRCTSLEVHEDRVVLEYEPIEIRVEPGTVGAVLDGLRVFVVNMGSSLIAEKVTVVVEILA